MSEVEQAFSFEDFAVTGVARNSNTPSIKDLSVEAAREFVKVVDGNTKIIVEGYQGLTLKLGRMKLKLDAIVPKAVKFQVPEAQVEAVSAQLLAKVADGTLDEAIQAVLTSLNTVKATSAEAPNDAEFEGFDEELQAAEATEEEPALEV